MALARVKVWIPGDVLTAADLNGEINNVLNNPITLISPTTGVISFSTAQTFPINQLVATSAQTGSIISGSTATSSPFVAGTVVTPGTAPLQVVSSVQLQLGLGTIPLKIGTQWVQRQIPAAVTFSATSTGGTGGALVASRTYFMYAFDSTGTTALDYASTSVIPHSPSTENGVEVATTDATRTLVGMFRTNASTQFSDGGNERFVASWYGRRSLSAVGAIVTASSFNRTTYAEHSSAGRAEFVTWGDKTVSCLAGGGDMNNQTINGFVFAAIGLDGGTSSVAGRGAGGGQSAAAGERFFWAAQANFATSQATEGYHFVTLATRVNTSTGVLQTGTDPETTIVQANLVI